MNTKFNLIVIALIIISIIFVPLIPDEGIDCSYSQSDCEDSAGYISIYSKYLK